MAILLITAALVFVMYGLTLLSYISESHVLDDLAMDN